MTATANPINSTESADSWFTPPRLALFLFALIFATYPGIIL
jgi:hypothetical protein